MNGMDSPMREALRRQESACAHDVPAFASIAARIEAAPLAGSRPNGGRPPRARAWRRGLVAAQVRVVPYAVLAAAVVVAAAAVAGACLIGMTGVRGC